MSTEDLKRQAEKRPEGERRKKERDEEEGAKEG